jgi:EAL domain-containing protein (putative c-di-GMP-specific phosphodiesterase class I)
MYQAKAKGPGHVEIFDAAAMQARSAERLDLESALRRAIDRDELEVHFQPIFAAAGSPIIGTEALVRWNHPRRGVIHPGEFVPLAEETGLILSMGRYVLERACHQARVWHDQLDAPLTTSINLSARQFQQPGLSEEIGYIIDRAGVDPSRVCLEITESVAMTDADRTIAILHELKSLGVLLAIDDFGTGYSSLGYLKRFPVDIVKVDRSFVAGIGVNAVDEAIVAAVVNLAHAIGMTTVAEGVETAEQLEHLRGLGCKGVQGFYFARPAPAAEVSLMLEDQQADARRAGLKVVRDAG